MPAVLNAATPDYRHTIGSPIVDGRDFDAGDQPNSQQVVIVDQELVRQMGLGPHVVGRDITTRWPSEKPWGIVGVAGHILVRPDPKTKPQVFMPATQLGVGLVTFVARVHGAPQPYLAACRAAVQQVDPHVPVYDVKTRPTRSRSRRSTPPRAVPERLSRSCSR